MTNINKLIGRMWSLRDSSKDLNSLLWFETEHSLLLSQNKNYFECTFETNNGSIVIKSAEEVTLNGEYFLEFRDNCIIITSNKQSLLVGEWKVAEIDEEQPLKLTGFDRVDTAIDRRNWMASISSSRSLKDMCIPGTHDSAAYKMDKTFFAPWTLTQERNFTEQLSDGIRAFDLRLSEGMNFFHGKFYLSQNIYSCLDAMVKYLNEYPTETIIITVKPENCDDIGKFKTNFSNVLKRYSDYFYTNTHIPALGEVRKKIVLLRRFDFNVGINMTNWPDNTTFENKDSKGLTIKVQDRYNASYDDKHRWLLQDFDNAVNRQSLMYITYFSLQSSGNDLRYVSAKVQNRFINSKVWQDMGQRRYIGIYPFDYYNQSLIPWFIFTNFK